MQVNKSIALLLSVLVGSFTVLAGCVVGTTPIASDSPSPQPRCHLRLQPTQHRQLRPLLYLNPRLALRQLGLGASA